MKKFLAFLLLAIATTASATTPALVQNTTQGGFSTAPTIALTGVASGDFLSLCVIGRTSGNTVSSVTDSNGTVSTAIAMSAPSSGVGVGLYFVANTASGAHTLTVTFSASSPDETLLLGEFSGVATSSPLDQTPPAINAGTGNTVTTGSITPTANGELLNACAAQVGSGGALSSWTNSFTQIAVNTSSNTGGWASLVQATAASISAGVTMNGGAADPFAAGIVAFKAAGGGTSCTHTALTSGGTIAVPTAGATSITPSLKSGASGTTPCDGTGTQWFQPLTGTFGTQ